MSKGSKRRKPLVDTETISDNWDRIFNTETENESKSKEISVQSDRDSSGESKSWYWSDGTPA